VIFFLFSQSYPLGSGDLVFPFSQSSFFLSFFPSFRSRRRRRTPTFSLVEAGHARGRRLAYFWHRQALLLNFFVEAAIATHSSSQIETRLVQFRAGLKLSPRRARRSGCMRATSGLSAAVVANPQGARGYETFHSCLTACLPSWRDGISHVWAHH
jgi:hypothetical protein